MSQRQYLIYQDITEPTNITFVAETITVDKWFKEQPNPVLRKSLPVAILAGSFFFFNTASIEANAKVPEWHPQTNQPQRLVSKLPRQNTGEYRFELPRTILLSDWFEPIRQPYFPKRRTLPHGEYRFEVPRTILISDWFQPTPQPRIVKLRQNLGGMTPRLDIIADDTQINEWFEPIRQPYFPKLRNYRTGEFRFEVPRTILLSDWWQKASEPQRGKLRQILGGEIHVNIGFVEIITVDKWFMPTQQPYIKRYVQTPGGMKLEILASREFIQAIFM